MSHLSLFNTAVYEFIADLKKMNILSNEIAKLETYVEVTRVNARAIISNFQSNLLRDVFVQNILKNNVHFFIEYDATSEVSGDNTALTLIKRIQELVRTMASQGASDNIALTLKHLKVLCFHAYADLGIDAASKFRSLM